ncbi:MAG: pilus assembly protein [Actinomycetota bacterium]|nr:pilus assembly protein [Actinomycetota bacterium]
MANTQRSDLKEDERGQATVEFVALIPLVLLVVLVLWQSVLAGHATWAAGAAARAAARAHAVGQNAEAAARGHLPHNLEPGLHVRPQKDGAVEVEVRIPRVVRGVDLGHATSSAHFADQGA